MDQQWSVIEAVVALTHDQETGTRRRDPVSLGVINAAAVMSDLIVSGHLVLGPGRRRTLAVGPATAPLTPPLEQFVRDVVAKKPSNGLVRATWLGRTRTLSAMHAVGAAKKSMAERDLVRMRHVRIAGRDTTQIGWVNPEFQRAIEERVRTALDGGPADHRTLAVAWVLHGGWMLRKSVPGYGAIRVGRAARRLEARDQLAEDLRRVGRSIGWAIMMRSSSNYG